MTLTANPVAITNFGTIKDRQNLLKKKRLKDVINIGTIATLFFIIADFSPLNIKWSAVQTESWYLVALLAAVSAVILDYPMYLAGRKIKEYMVHLINKKQMLPTVIIAVTAFLIVYVPFFAFSMVTKDATFEEALPLGSSTIMSFDSTEATAPSNPLSVTVAAIFSAILPLGTSLSSLVCGIVTYNPIEDRLERLEEVKLLAQEHNSALKWGKAQLSECKKLLIERERDLYDNQIKEIKTQQMIRIQAYEEALEEALNTDGILRVTDHAKSLIASAGFTDTCNPSVLNELLRKDNADKSIGTINYPPDTTPDNNVA